MQMRCQAAVNKVMLRRMHFCWKFQKMCTKSSYGIRLGRVMSKQVTAILKHY